MSIFSPFVFRSKDATQQSGGTIPSAGLVFDLDARFDVFNDAGSTEATNGQTVQEWTTGGGGLGGIYTFEQLTAIDKPTLLQDSTFGGQPYVRFLGDADSLVEHVVAPYHVDFLLQEQTVFMVGRNRETVGNGSFGHFWRMGEGVSEGFSMHLETTSGSEWSYNVDDWSTGDIHVTSTGATEYIYQGRYDPSTNFNARQNGDTQVTSTPPTSIAYTNTIANSVGWAIGGMFQSPGTIVRELSFDITRLLVYDRYLSDVERDEVTATFNTLYSTY
jgi:hypothetical protein